MAPKLTPHTPQSTSENIKDEILAVNRTRFQTALLALALLAGGN